MDEADVELRFVTGFVTGVAADLDHDPTGHRRQQRRVVGSMEVPGWTAVIPELYAEDPTASRVDDAVPLRTWNAAAVGTTRYPVGLVRLVAEGDTVPEIGPLAPTEGWTPTRHHVTVWPDGAGVASFGFRWRWDGERATLAAARRTIDVALDRQTHAVTTVLGSILPELLRALGAAGVEVAVGAGAVRTVGRHRHLAIAAHPGDELIAALRDEVVLLGTADEFGDVCADRDRFCFAGNGWSVDVCRDPARVSPVIEPVLDLYEYWIAALTATDDLLADEFAGLSAAGRPPSDGVTSLKDHARKLTFAHRDVLNAMSPTHSAAWAGYLSTWRITQLEHDVAEKVLAVEELTRSLCEAAANRIATRTSILVTFLTALTLVSLVTGVAAFVLLETSLRLTVRLALVVSSLLAAVLLFVAAVRPIAVSRARAGR